MNRPRDPRIAQLIREGRRLPSSPLLSSPITPSSPSEPSSSTSAIATRKPEDQIISDIVNPITLQCLKPDDHNLVYAFYNSFKNINPQSFNKQIHKNAVETMKYVFFKNAQACQQLIEEKERLKADLVAKETQAKIDNVFVEDAHHTQIKAYKNEIGALKQQIQQEREESANIRQALETERYDEWLKNTYEIVDLQKKVRALQEEKNGMKNESYMIRSTLEAEKQQMKEKLLKYGELFGEIEKTIEKAQRIGAKDNVERRKRSSNDNSGDNNDDERDDGTTSKRKK